MMNLYGQEAMNNDHFELEWITSTCEASVNFMDLTITISADRVHITLFEEKRSIYFYIPPNSCHPLVLVQDMVRGIIYYSMHGTN